MAMTHFRWLSVCSCLGPLLGPIQSCYRIYSIVPTDGTANAGRNPVVSPVPLRRFPGGKMPGSALLAASGWRRGWSRSTIRSPTSQEFPKD